MDRPKVSVIIPKTKKENITKSIDAIQNSSYRYVEIIVVDEGKERSEQRNIGIGRAKGKYLLILDADQVPHAALIRECVLELEYHPDIQAMFIPEVIPGKGWFNRVRNFERQFYTGTAVDVVRFIRADDCPLFDKTMSGPEDSDWDRRVTGGKSISANCLYHYDNIGLKKYIQKKAYYAKSMRRYHELHPDDKVLSLQYRCFGIFVENGKWKRLLRHPVLSLGVLFILIVRGVIWLKK